MEEIFIKYISHNGISLKICGDNTHIKEVSFVDSEGTSNSQVSDIVDKAATQLMEYLKGERQVFDLNLNPDGTEFQKKVWKVLLEIPFGKTLNYAQVAQQLGNPKVIRAAASANGKNPIAIIIPCHRVIGTNGSLTGYAGGLENKRFLLNLENANGVLSIF